MSEDPIRRQYVDGSSYPPGRTGLRGSHLGSFDVAHEIRDGRRFDVGDLPVEESYDLVVVGAGISGLASAWFFRRAPPGRLDPAPGQPRRLRRPRQAQRVHGRGPFPAGLRRLRGDAVSRGALRARGQGHAAGARHRLPPVRAVLRHRSVPVAGVVARGLLCAKRPSARIGSSPATRCGWSPTTSPPIACTSGRPRRSSRTSRCRRRPRRSCSSFTHRRAIPFPPWPRPRRSSTCRGPATATTCRRSGGSPTRRPIRSRGGRMTSSRSGSTACRRSTPWKPATRASRG